MSRKFLPQSGYRAWQFWPMFLPSLSAAWYSRSLYSSTISLVLEGLQQKITIDHNNLKIFTCVVSLWCMIHCFLYQTIFLFSRAATLQQNIAYPNNHHSNRQLFELCLSFSKDWAIKLLWKYYISHTFECVFMRVDARISSWSGFLPHAGIPSSLLLSARLESESRVVLKWL